jgi:hypothetical protein
MFNNASPQTKSFVVLILVVAFGSIFSLWLIGFMKGEPGFQYTQTPASQKPADKTQQLGEPMVLAKEIADTSTWKDFVDTKYGLSFKYNPDWKIKPWATNKEGYDVLEIDPGKKYYNIKVYASEKNYYVMDGLPAEKTTVGGMQALDVSDLLYGVKKGSTYLTFDLGLSLTLKAQFNGLVESIKFQ